MTIITGDFSHYTWDRHGGNPDWAIAKTESGIEVACIRATYGDPAGFHPETRHFRTMAVAAKAAGLYVGGYHNLIHGDSASLRRQVEWFRSELNSVNADWAMLDIEAYEALRLNNLWPRLTDVEGFLRWWDVLESRRRLVLYLARWFWRDFWKEIDITSLDGPMVNAHYPGGNPPSENPLLRYTAIGGDTGVGWSSYGGKAPELWQFSSYMALLGISPREDVNAFRGTVNTFRTLVTKGVSMAAPNFTLTKPNPSPNYITDALWWFWLTFKAYEPTVAYGGIYANKRGFHNRGDQVVDYGVGDSRTDYSIRDAINRTGPYWRTRASAIDLTFYNAQRGDYSTIAKYTKRIIASAKSSTDPRLDDVMFEVYGQADADSYVEGYREYGDRDATSDASHLWHIHISFLRPKCGDFWAMWAMLTVLMGWSVEQWRASLPVPTELSPATTKGIIMGLQILRVGSTGRQVRTAQALLNQFGWNAGTVDGQFGTGTAAAVKRMQARAGRTQTGRIESAEWQLLLVGNYIPGVPV